MNAKERYDDAIDFQHLCLNAIKGPHGSDWFSAFDISVANAEINGYSMLTAVRKSLEYGTPYYWSPMLTSMMQAVAERDMPDHELDIQLPSPHGFWYFGTLLRAPPIIFNDGVSRCAGIRAISWTPVRVAIQSKRGTIEDIPDATTSFSFFVETDDIPESFGLSVIHKGTRHRSGTQYMFRHSTTLERIMSDCTDIARDFKTLISQEQDIAFQARSRFEIKLIIACMEFLRTRIFVPQPQPLERATRRRLEREKIPAPELKVMQLRRRQVVSAKDSAAEDTESREVEWSCQWLVSGHWRNAWYPSTGEHKLRWILPYIKGPIDKPFKETTGELFAVVR